MTFNGGVEAYILVVVMGGIGVGLFNTLLPAKSELVIEQAHL